VAPVWSPEDTHAALVERCHELGWTDGLPVLPPTPARVEAMLGDWSDRRDEVVAVLPPVQGEATVEAIAANCVLAGCLPAHLPVVVAAVRALAKPRFGLEAVVTGVHAMAPLVVLDGPIVDELGANSGAGVLGSGNRANAAIGRAVQLITRNLAGAVPGVLDASTHGHPGRYSFLVAATPGPWAPLRTRLGYDETESIVVVKAADAPLCIADMGHDDPTAILRTIAASVAIPGAYNAFFRDELWLVTSPEHAFALAAAGIDPDAIGRFMHEHATIPAGRLRGHGLYGFIDDAIRPTWLDHAADDEPIPIVDRPDRVRVVVAGGDAGGYTAALLGQGVSVAERIER
jgi:hypothetical protein